MIHIEKKQGRIHLTLDAYFMGEDLVVLISGGDQPVGTITAGARLEPLQTVQLQNHKEFYITEEIAVLLRKNFSGNFAICCSTIFQPYNKGRIETYTGFRRPVGDRINGRISEKQGL